MDSRQQFANEEHDKAVQKLLIDAGKWEYHDKPIGGTDYAPDGTPVAWHWHWRNAVDSELVDSKFLQLPAEPADPYDWIGYVPEYKPQLGDHIRLRLVKEVLREPKRDPNSRLIRAPNRSSFKKHPLHGCPGYIVEDLGEFVTVQVDIKSRDLRVKVPKDPQYLCKIEGEAEDESVYNHSDA